MKAGTFISDLLLYLWHPKEHLTDSKHEVNICWMGDGSKHRNKWSEVRLVKSVSVLWTREPEMGDFEASGHVQNGSQSWMDARVVGRSMDCLDWAWNPRLGSWVRRPSACVQWRNDRAPGGLVWPVNRPEEQMEPHWGHVLFLGHYCWIYGLDL